MGGREEQRVFLPKEADSTQGADEWVRESRVKRESADGEDGIRGQPAVVGRQEFNVHCERSRFGSIDTALEDPGDEERKE